MTAESSYSQRFVIEAREHLAGMTSALIALERGDGDARSHVDQLLRAAHSIKGGAGFTGRHQIERLAHSLETAIENVRDGRVAATPEAIDILLAALDRVSGMIDDLDHSDDVDISVPLARLAPLIDAGGGADPANEHRGTGSELAPVRSSLATHASPAQLAEFPLSERVRSGWHEGSGFLYGVKLDWFACERELGVDTSEIARRIEGAGALLDSRTELAGPSLRQGLPTPPLWWRAIISSALEPAQFAKRLDISCATIFCLHIVAQDSGASAGPNAAASPAAGAAAGPAPASAPRLKASVAPTSLRISVPLIDRMMELAGELALVRNQAVRSTDPANAPLRRLMRRLDSVTTELQDAALRMRMQPVASLFDRFPRMVRDLARQLGKQVELEVTGSEVELDKTVLELLADPLTHLIRNCCDHGIELPDVRARKGKSPHGLIRLSAKQDRGQIIIEVRDDGKGLDRDAIKRKAIEQRLRRPEELDALSERQLYDLILLSGFSTAAKVTDVSGRGVGMDVVKTNLDQIGGMVEIDSSAGNGTRFSLRLPLTLAIMPCLLVASEAARYAIPQRDLAEIVLLEPNGGRFRVECAHDQEVLRLRGSLLPIVRLSEVLGSRDPFTAETRAGLIARHHEHASTERQYVAVLRVGSSCFGLLVDEVLESEDIVVKPLHPVLRPLGVFGAATILGDGGVALILSGDGIARHSGILHRPLLEAASADAEAETAGALTTLLMFRYGAAELLAMPLAAVRRVVMIRREDIEHVGDRELVNVDGAPINVLRLDRLLNLSTCPDSERFSLILPRGAEASVGLLASQIVDTPTLPVQIDEQAYKVDGIRGSLMIGGQIAVFLDVERLAEMWSQAHGGSRRARLDGARRKILVVEDTQFFERLIKSYLEEAGFEVVVAGNGREGLDRLGVGTFDLIISDIEMPVMDGFAFARRVREDPRHAAVPMLALTTLSSLENRDKALKCGFDGYEVKLDRRSLLACVGDLLARGHSGALAAARTPGAPLP